MASQTAMMVDTSSLELAPAEEKWMIPAPRQGCLHDRDQCCETCDLEQYLFYRDER